MAENDINFDELDSELNSADFDTDFASDFDIDNISSTDDFDFLDGLNLDGEKTTGSDKDKNMDSTDVDFGSESSSSGEKKNFFKKIIDSIVNFVKTEKILSIVIGSLILLFIVIIILICVFTASKNKKKVEPEVVENKVDLPYEYVLPSSEILDSYTFSRDLKDNWTLEEGEKWFEIPDGKMMKDLENKNTENIFEILEEVP